LLRPLNSL
ncbi:hypothetical protein CFOL_v3_02646, partial [Cephalotus follicularis]